MDKTSKEPRPLFRASKALINIHQACQIQKSFLERESLSLISKN